MSSFEESIATSLYNFHGNNEECEYGIHILSEKFYLMKGYLNEDLQDIDDLVKNYGLYYGFEIGGFPTTTVCCTEGVVVIVKTSEFAELKKLYELSEKLAAEQVIDSPGLYFVYKRCYCT